jgi:hypothetical protein
MIVAIATPAIASIAKCWRITKTIRRSSDDGGSSRSVAQSHQHTRPSRRVFRFRRTKMSAQHIYDHAPLGAMIRFSDHTPQPPARFKRKLAAWEDRNACGRLIRKSPPHEIGLHRTEPSFTLHMGDYGGSAVIVLVVNRVFGLGNDLDFTIESLPQAGAVRVLQECSGQSELLNLASGSADAQRWLTTHRYSNVRLEKVGTSKSAGVAP